MSSKTKIVVLHLKELIYTGIFIVLGILFLVLLLVMFLPGKDKKESTVTSESAYIPGVYTTTLTLNDTTLDIEVVVDKNNINSVRLINLNETITTMYPLIEPSFDDLTKQIYEKQTLDDVTYGDDNKYTSMVLLDGIRSSLEKAKATLDE